MTILGKICKHLKEFEEIEKEKNRKKREEEEKLRQALLEHKKAPIIGDDSVDENDIIGDEELDREFREIQASSRCLVIKDYVVPPFNPGEPDPHAPGATAKFKRRFGQYLAFIKCVEYYRAPKFCSLLDLATTSKALQRIFGTYRTVSNQLETLEEIGLIKEWKQAGYKPGSPKSYFYYVENEEKIIELCKKKKISKYVHKSEIKLTKKEELVVKNDIENILGDEFRKKVLFKSRLKLRRPNSIRPGQFKIDLKRCLELNYPGLKIYQHLVDYINDKYYSNDENLKLTFEPTFHWNEPKFDENGRYIKDSSMKTIVGIGIRVGNKYCSAKKDNNVSQEDKRKLRKEVIDEYGFKFEKDITSSVPRVSFALNFGGWLKDDVDLYKKIYEQYDPNGDNFLEERQNIKDLFFRTYFDSTDKNLGYHTWRKMTHDGMDKTEVYATMAKLRRAVESALGETRYNNYIFYVESCIYIDVLHVLLAKGYKVWIVYDCFYGAGFGTQKEFEELVLNAVVVCFVRFKMAYDYDDWGNILKDIESL